MTVLRIPVALAVLALAAPAVPDEGCAGLDPLILDLDGNGVDLGGQTTTSLISGALETVRWTKPDAHDAFLMVEATQLRQAGWNIQNAQGTPLYGPVMFRDGLRVSAPGGSPTTTTDAWHMLTLFDQNQNGTISSSDAVWGRLRLFRDLDANGYPDISDPMQDMSGIAFIALNGIQASQTDAHGNQRRDGIGRRVDSSSFTTTGVILAKIAAMTASKKSKKKPLAP